MVVLAKTFPSEISAIQALRLRDPIFDEICTDFEKLALLLPKSIENPSLPDIQLSMAELELEIRQYLGAVGVIEQKDETTGGDYH